MLDQTTKLSPSTTVSSLTQTSDSDITREETSYIITKQTDNNSSEKSSNAKKIPQIEYPSLSDETFISATVEDFEYKSSRKPLPATPLQPIPSSDSREYETPTINYECYGINETELVISDFSTSEGASTNSSDVKEERRRHSHRRRKKNLNRSLSKRILNFFSSKIPHFKSFSSKKTPSTSNFPDALDVDYYGNATQERLLPPLPAPQEPTCQQEGKKPNPLARYSFVDIQSNTTPDSCEEHQYDKINY